MLKHGPHRLFEVFFYLILNYYLQLKCNREDFTLALTSIVYSRIVPHRHMYCHCLLRIKSKNLGRLPHHNPFIAQFMLGLLISQVDYLPRHPDTPHPPGQMLSGGFCIRNRVAVGAVVTVDPIKSRKPLESFLFGFGCLGGGVSGRLGRHSTRSPSVFDLQIEGKRQSRLISGWRV